MPREGIFVEILEPGSVKAGDVIEIQEMPEIEAEADAS